MHNSEILPIGALVNSLLYRMKRLLWAAFLILATSGLWATNEKNFSLRTEKHASPEMVLKQAEKAFQLDQYEEVRLALQALSKMRHPQARTWLGFMLALGLGGDIDQKKSKKLLMAAARSGSAPAARYLIWKFDAGDIDSTDEDEADEIRTLSRKNTKGLGITHFGWMVVDGESFRNNYQNTLDYISGLAKKDIRWAQYNMGVIYEEGRGVPTDMKEALIWYKKAADNGHNKAQFRIGKFHQDAYFGKPDFKAAVKWYKKAANQDHISADTHLAHLYANGRGVDRSDRLALRHYRKAAIRGDVEAQSELGYWYKTGREVDEDPLQSIYWLELAAKNGDLRSQTQLGQLYLGGQGVNGDSDKALYWLEKAAKRKSPAALYALGEMYWRGLGIGEDKEAAFELYLRAAKLGEPGAQTMVAIYYTQNLNNPPAMEEAVKWMERAAGQGYPEAEYQLALWFQQGFGLPKDTSQFIELLDRAATQGVLQAQVLQKHINLSDKTIDEAVAQHFKFIQSRYASQKYLELTAEETKFNVDLKNRPPQPIHVHSPRYPIHLEGTDLHGTVTVILLVNENGFVSEASVEKSFHPDFEQPTLDAIKQWRFNPALRDGTPIVKEIRVPIKF
ncbi:MAG: Secretory immunoglobulin A-binding protein EsiB [Candidatus Moanabacter tarae]|uniref:Secretory immunoglobulin A-binding protein EsiB n=1 Tax=Candidatus Moanibacter tarae TaxID=2200854 RepID=A0A2Z4AMC1_9BACT|nr:MAG: Secretory immunoglobulin A-binding protein EsiB [Candidatus Moanabacter tarae]